MLGCCSMYCLSGGSEMCQVEGCMMCIVSFGGVMFFFGYGYVVVVEWRARKGRLIPFPFFPPVSVVIVVVKFITLSNYLFAS